MNEMANGNPELQKLKQIKNMLTEKANLTVRIDQAKKRVEDIDKQIDNAKYESLPTDLEKREYTDISIKAYDNGRFARIAVAVIGIFIVLAYSVFLAVKMQSNEISLGVGMVFVVALLISVALMIAGIICIWEYKYIFGSGAVALAIGAYMCSIIHWIYLAVLVAICALGYGAYRLVDNMHLTPRFSDERRNTITAAREKDRANAAENLRRQEEAQRRLRLRLEPELVQAKEEINRCTSRLRSIDREIAAMDVISQDDMAYIDFLIQMIETKRADSIKEALLLLDQKRAADRKKALDDYNDLVRKQENDRLRREKEMEDDRRFWSDLREKERLNEHRKNMEDELRKIREKLEE